MAAAVSSRARLLQATLDLLAQARDADEVSTRAICERAGVQAPTLYHYFGDKRGLLDATAQFAFERYASRTAASSPAPDQLRQAWDAGLRFGLDHPALYAAIFGRPTGVDSPAADRLHAPLVTAVRGLAEADLLTVPADTAVALVVAAHTGATLSAIALLPARDATAESVRDTVLASVSRPAAARKRGGSTLSAAAAAAALASAIRDNGADEVLGSAESGLLLSWLDKFGDR